MKSILLFASISILFVSQSFVSAAEEAGDTNSAGASGTPDTSVLSTCPNLKLRGNLDNSRIVFEKTGAGNVAFLGGSITEREGYRPLVCAELQKEFPHTKFTFTNAGIGSTASITGAFRFPDEVLSHGSIDLLFVEFAVNDDQDAHYTQAECICGMEGIIRHLWLKNPNADVVMTYFVNGHMLQDFGKGNDPLTSSSHTIVAEKYGVSTVELNRELADRIKANQMTWNQYGGVHPAPIGNSLGANMIIALLNKAWSTPLAATAVVTPHVLPDPIDANSYFNGHFIDLDQAKITGGWTVSIPDWKSIDGKLRPMFANRKLICATEPGAELTLPFDGKAIGIYLLSGPDAGIVEASIDNATVQRFDLFRPFGNRLQYPCSIVFNGDLSPGSHTLVLKLTGDKNSASKGTAARILEFCGN